MKSFILRTAYLSIAALLFVSASAIAAVNPDAIDLGMDVKGLDAEALKLHKNAVYARHCKYFTEAHARAAFRGYQENKCGSDFYWGDPKPFDENKLSKAEKDFIARVEKREAELRKSQIKKEGGKLVFDRNAVVNISQFRELSPRVMDKLFQNGFVAVPSEHEQLFQVYEGNDYKLIPNFITTDSVLQLYHLYFDFTLRQIEEEKLLPEARSLCIEMAMKLNGLKNKYKTGSENKALNVAVVYFAVAEDMATMSPEKPKEGEGEEEIYDYEHMPEPGPPELISEDDYKRPPPAWLDTSLHADFLLQRELILKAKETKKGPIMGTVDYTMFIPRGHYTRSKALAAYFRTLMWMGLPGFILDDNVMPVETPLIISHVLTGDPTLMQKYNLIYEPTCFYVGPTDDITPMLVKEVADEICGKDSSLDAWLAKKDEIVKELIKRDPTRIRITNLSPEKMSQLDDRNKPQVRVMGMRYIPDSEMFQRLTHFERRPFPTGLDVFGVMGVETALKLLKDSKIEWDGYWPAMEELQVQFKDMKPQSGEDNLYWRWMHLLKTLNQPPPAAAPETFKTPAWQAKNLTTSLASWAELRHDTILYAKPAFAEGGGEEEMPPRMVGYVEPRPDVFKELLELQRLTYTSLEKKGLLTERLTNVGADVEEVFKRLLEITEKEVAGKTLSDDDYGYIKRMGNALEWLTIGILTDPYNDWYQVTGPDRFVAVIADVHTAGDTTLEEGVGFPDEIYVLAEIEGELYITRGALLSYYEFTWPSKDRLTDEKWQQTLRDGKAPPRPSWIDEYWVGEKAKEFPLYYDYSPGGY